MFSIWKVPIHQYILQVCGSYGSSVCNANIKCFNVRLSSKNSRNNRMGNAQALIRQTLDRNHQPSTNEWCELREKLLSMQRTNKTSVNIDTVILGTCLPTQLDTAKSYMKYLKESGCSEPNTSTLINLLKLYYRASKAGTVITNSDQQDIIDMYEHLLKKYPIFDSALSEGIIHGLVLTADWRKSLEILDSIKILAKGMASAYSAVVQRAIQEEDELVVWNLLNDMVAECPTMYIQNNVFVSYIGFCEKYSDTFTENINKMLMFIEDNEILISTKVANEFQRAFRRFNYNCSITPITKQGKCQSCGNRLRNVHVTDDEFNNLSSHFLDKIFIGNNVFIQSTPQELNAFIAFVDRTKPYDCVIDGLNVANTSQATNPLVKANMLASVVKYFVDQNKTVLVIGRRHMERWPKSQMNYIRKTANLFLTENLSEDDPFIIYSTLRSGSTTDFITRDLIRNHAFKLDKDLKKIFRRWQQQHQYMIQWIHDNGKITFEEPIEFDMTAHQVAGCWHIPFESDSHCTIQRPTFELRKNWLCVSKEG